MALTQCIQWRRIQVGVKAVFWTDEIYIYIRLCRHRGPGLTTGMAKGRRESELGLG
jgi:hypothetical protein